MTDLLELPTFAGKRLDMPGYVELILRTDLEKGLPRPIALVVDQASGLNHTSSRYVATYGDWRWEGDTIARAKEQLFRHLDRTLTFGVPRAQSWDGTDVHPLLA